MSLDRFWAPFFLRKNGFYFGVLPPRGRAIALGVLRTELSKCPCNFLLKPPYSLQQHKERDYG
jgi:hypothetical protein